MFSSSSSKSPITLDQTRNPPLNQIGTQSVESKPASWGISGAMLPILDGILSGILPPLELEPSSSRNRIIEPRSPDSAVALSIRDARWTALHFDSPPTIGNRMYSIEPNSSGQGDHHTSCTKETAINQSGSKLATILNNSWHQMIITIGTSHMHMQIAE